MNSPQPPFSSPTLPADGWGGAVAPPSRPQAAGLVPSKTSPNTEVLINLDQGACAGRRVKRMKRSVWVSGHLHAIPRPGFRPGIPWFVTATYADEDGWQANHIAESTDRFRRWCDKHGYPCQYTWVAEIQPGRAIRTGKEVVHYHLIAWLPPKVVMPKWDVMVGRRRAFWPHGMTNTQIAKAGVGYLMKYLSKLGEFSHFPKGLRLYGIGGLNAVARSVRTWINLPEWAKCSYGVGDLVRSSRGFMVQATGEILKSPYVVSLVPGGLIVRAIAPIPERFHSGAYSTYRVGEAR